MVIKGNIKNNGLAKLIQKKPLNCTTVREFNLPKTVSALQEKLVYNNKLSVSKNVKEFINLLIQTNDQSKHHQIFTESQVKREEQGIHWQGRITESIFYRAFTRVNTSRKQPDGVTDSIFERIMEGLMWLPQPKQLSKAEH